jgi:hypothetical protein
MKRPHIQKVGERNVESIHRDLEFVVREVPTLALERVHLLTMLRTGPTW